MIKHYCCLALLGMVLSLNASLPQNGSAAQKVACFEELTLKEQRSLSCLNKAVNCYLIATAGDLECALERVNHCLKKRVFVEMACPFIRQGTDNTVSPMRKICSLLVNACEEIERSSANEREVLQALKSRVARLKVIKALLERHLFMHGEGAVDNNEPKQD